MQCPHCFKDDLDDRATRCPHCTGYISKTSIKKEAAKLKKSLSDFAKIAEPVIKKGACDGVKGISYFVRLLIAGMVAGAIGLAPLMLLMFVTFKIRDSAGLDIMRNVVLGVVVLGVIFMKYVGKLFEWYFDLIITKVYAFFGIDER